MTVDCIRIISASGYFHICKNKSKVRLICIAFEWLVGNNPPEINTLIAIRDIDRNATHKQTHPHTHGKEGEEKDNEGIYDSFLSVNGRKLKKERQKHEKDKQAS